MFVCVWDRDTSRHTVTDNAARRQTPVDETGVLSQTAAALALGTVSRVGRYTQKTPLHAHLYTDMYIMHIHVYTNIDISAEIKFHLHL